AHGVSRPRIEEPAQGAVSDSLEEVALARHLAQVASLLEQVEHQVLDDVLGVGAADPVGSPDCLPAMLDVQGDDRLLRDDAVPLGQPRAPLAPLPNTPTLVLPGVAWR